MKWRVKEKTKDQWNKEVALWREKQDWQTVSQSKRKKEKAQINEIRAERGDIKVVSWKFRILLDNILGTQQSNKLENIEGMGKFLRHMTY